MNEGSRSEAESARASRPILSRLLIRLRRARAERVRAEWTRALSQAATLHLVAVTVFGTLSAADPWRAAWPTGALIAWACYLWPLTRFWHARRRPSHRLEAVAASLDAANPGAPDVFRTLLSVFPARRSSGTSDDRTPYAPSTLDALEALYAGWEPRLVFPGPDARAKRRRILWRALLVFAALFAIVFPFAAARAAEDLFPAGAAGIFERAWLPAKALSETPSPRLAPLELPEEVPEGDTLRLRVRVDHVSPRRQVHVHVIDGAGEIRHVMTRRGALGDTALFALGPVTSDLKLRFSTPGFASRVYRVRKRPPPRLKRLSLTVTPPAYARRPMERFAETPALISALPGSVLAWEAESAEPLAELAAEFRFEGREATRTSFASKDGRGPYTFRRVSREGFELRVRLTDALGGRAVEGPFRVEPSTDAPPEIAWREPTEDGELGRALRLPVRFTVKDDYGVSRVSLHYAVSREGGKPVKGARDLTEWLGSRGALDREGAGVWNAEGLGLQGGDEVEVWLEATDNDAVSGPKSARTSSLRLRLPSREEALADARAGEREAAVSLSSALEREGRLRRERERPDRGASRNEGGNPNEPAMAEWELQRILSDQPRRHLQEMKRALELEARNPETRESQAPEPGRRESQALRREVEAQEKRLPPPSVARAPAEEQRKALERLSRDQEALKKAMDAAAPKSPPRPEDARARRQAAERERLREALEGNRREQESLRKWMDERDRAQAADRARAEQARRHEERMRQDMKTALEQIDKTLERGLENGTLSPDMLEKMERIRELVEEVLREDEKQALRRAGEQPVDAEDLRRAMQEMLSTKEGVRENLESAIRMLESLKDTRALRDLAEDVEALGDAQKDLAARMESSEGAQALAKAQQEIARRLDASRAEMERLAKRPGLSELKAQKQGANEARTAMENAREALQKPSGGDRKEAKKGADLAARRLQKTAEQMRKTLAKTDEASDGAELRSTLEETLEFSRWLETLGASRAAPEWRAWGGEAGAREAAVRVARWLAARWKRLADGRPFASDVLRREAAGLGFEADALAALPAGASTSGGAGLDAMRRRAQSAARELLKWLNEDQGEGGSESGEGEGDNASGGGNSGDSGEEGLSGRMRGTAARQNAVNQATQELLQSFLRQRQPRDGAPRQGGEGPGGSGRPSRQGSGAGGAGGSSPGEESGAGESAEGRQDGGSSSGFGEGSREGGEGAQGQGAGASRAAANRQQQIAEALEQWAESADDGGGSARKLRQLAAEARELEAALRGLRLDPEEVRRRQERFRTRLLEAADALEERGRERERRAEAYQGGAVAAPEADADARDEEWLRVLKRRRDAARRLPLTPAQKRQVEWYYERLLNP